MVVEDELDVQLRARCTLIVLVTVEEERAVTVAASGSIIVISPTRKLPQELTDEAVVVERPLPDSAQLDEVLAGLTQTPGVKVNLTPAGREKLGQAALGIDRLPGTAHLR